jgi:hypothetical protein
LDRIVGHNIDMDAPEISPSLKNPVIHSLRMIVGCGMFGTALAGSLFGWTDYGEVARWLGVAIGMGGGIILKFRHLL